MRSTAAAAALLASLLVATPAGATPREFFGTVNSVTLTPSDFASLGRARIGTLRTLLVWREVEPTPGRRNWAAFDSVVENAALNGVRVMPTLFGSPRFAAPRIRFPPKTPAGRAAFARFAAGAAVRYGQGGTFWTGFAERHPGVPSLPVTHWQVWNEVNAPSYWGGRPSPKGYATLLRPVAASLHGADPAAQVVLAGLFPAPNLKHALTSKTYLRKLYRLRGITSSFEAAAIDPYAHTPAEALATVHETRRVMVANHDASTSLWITEVGWSTGGEDVAYRTSRAGQAAYLGAFVGALNAQRKALNIGGVIWYALRDSNAGGASWLFHTGLLTADGKPKPSLAALAGFTGGAG
jgi:hypothetical protein